MLHVILHLAVVLLTAGILFLLGAVRQLALPAVLGYLMLVASAWY